ncbi:MAG: hypothetical protein CMM93_01360 [Rickettsiales bacterium]|nr:hypothetical protein [Rickettsiales bacterium]
MRNTNAFSLVELSIVLVILGLLTGGILTGQSLIRAAELRSVVTEFQRYQTAIRSFQDKYMALPGDMRNATRFWGSANTAGAGGECANPLTDVGAVSSNTCNGNGNGMIDSPAGPSARYEEYRFWQQLANAGLIEGTYSGLDTGSGSYTIGTNAPRSRINNAGWKALYMIGNGSHYVNYNWGSVSEGNVLFLGSGAWVQDPTILTPEEAWNIDTKMDDGQPDQGKIKGGQRVNACVTNTAAPAAEYNLTNASAVCMLLFYWN